MEALIKKHQLVPHPEGGYFREVYRSGQKVVSPVADEERSALTHIYFLLLKGQVSRFHKVLHDELWNFYDGSPLRLIQFDGRHIKEEIIGRECDAYVSVVKGGNYQAAESTGAFSLVGCSVAPGFDFADFTMLDQETATLVEFIKEHQDYERFI